MFRVVSGSDTIIKQTLIIRTATTRIVLHSCTLLTDQFIVYAVAQRVAVICAGMTAGAIAGRSELIGAPEGRQRFERSCSTLAGLGRRPGPSLAGRHGFLPAGFVTPFSTKPNTAQLEPPTWKVKITQPNTAQLEPPT